MDVIFSKAISAVLFFKARHCFSGPSFLQDMVLPNAGSLVSGAVSIALMEPDCATLNATGHPSSDPNSVIKFCSNCITELSTGGIQDISLVAHVQVR